MGTVRLSGEAQVRLQLPRHRDLMVEASETLPEGKHQVRMEFKYDGGGLGKGGMVTLFVDGKQVGQGRVEHTHVSFFPPIQ